MTLGDLIFGAIAGYIILGLVWLAAGKIRRRRLMRERQKRVRSRMPVVRSINVARRRRDEEVPPLRMGSKY
jgi:hypothetical protein